MWLKQKAGCVHRNRESPYPAFHFALPCHLDRREKSVSAIWHKISPGGRNDRDAIARETAPNEVNGPSGSDHKGAILTKVKLRIACGSVKSLLDVGEDVSCAGISGML